MSKPGTGSKLRKLLDPEDCCDSYNLPSPLVMPELRQVHWPQWTPRYPEPSYERKISQNFTRTGILKITFSARKADFSAKKCLFSVHTVRFIRNRPQAIPIIISPGRIFPVSKVFDRLLLSGIDTFQCLKPTNRNPTDLYRVTFCPKILQICSKL